MSGLCGRVLVKRGGASIIRSLSTKVFFPYFFIQRFLTIQFNSKEAFHRVLIIGLSFVFLKQKKMRIGSAKWWKLDARSYGDYFTTFNIHDWTIRQTSLKPPSKASRPFPVVADTLNTTSKEAQDARSVERQTLLAYSTCVCILHSFGAYQWIILNPV